MSEVPVYGDGGWVVAVALVDDDDVALLAGPRWHLTHGYAQRKVWEDGHRRTQLMHRLVLGLARGDRREVDHRNRNRLDNRRSNLRVGAQAQNQQNREGVTGTSSRYRGVTWERARDKWRASVMLNRRTITLGRFEDEHEAGAATAAWRAEHMPFSQEAAERTGATSCGMAL